MQYVFLIFLLTAVLFPLRSFGNQYTQWNTTIPSSASGSYSESETLNGCSITGSYTRLSNGFIKKTIQSCSGCALCPTAGAVKFAVEAPGFSIFGQPILTTEGQITSAIARASACPTTTWNGVFVFSIWNSAGAHNLTNAVQPAYGVFSWNPATNQATISAVYSLASTTAIPGFPGLTLNGSCANGVVTFSGAGDRGGTMYISDAFGAVFKTLGNKSLFVLPQHAIPSATSLAGSYSAINYDDAATQMIRSMRLTMSGTVGSGDTLSNVETGAVNSAETWSFSNISINTPVNGMFTADLSLEGGAARKAACGAYLRNKNVIFCVAQSTNNAAAPMNWAMVSEGASLASSPTILLDTYSFAAGAGKLSQEMSGTDVAYDVTIQSDGKLVVVGTQSTNAGDVAIARYHQNGILDTAFDGDGKKSQAVGAGADYGYGVAVQPDGKIVVAADGSNNIAVLRYNSDGSLDQTFDGNSGSGNGIVVTDGSGTDYGRSVSLQPDGKIVVAGNLGGQFVVVRYLSNGVLDTTFSSDGRTDNLGANTGQKVRLQSDGKIVAVGARSCMSPAMQAFSSGFVARFNSNGSVDTSFGMHVSACATPAAYLDVAVQPDGKIVAAGFVSGGGVWVSRYLNNLTLDTNFDGPSGNGNGHVLLNMGTGGTTTGFPIALAQDGKIYVGSQANGDFAIARLNSTTGTLDNTFDGDGRGYIAVGAATDHPRGMAIQSDTKIVVVGDDGANFAIARFWP